MSEPKTLAEFRASLPFPLDSFQVEACQAVAAGYSVLVAAPTGAGKTVVGEFAIAHTLALGQKAFYTAPIKALSNQKFHELVQRYGPSEVGLLTGDNSINPDANIVVMTTEVLRNMLYVAAPAIAELGAVVLDEVHYLADRERGSVWEEVIIHLPARTAVIALSATVSNAEEFGAWLGEVRGHTQVVVTEQRPIPLWPHVLLREGLYDLYQAQVDATNPGPNPPVNQEIADKLKAQRVRHQRYHESRRSLARRSPPRFAIVDELDRNGLLPAIVFIFSRAGCEDAVSQLRAAGTVLTTAAQRVDIAEIVDRRIAGIPVEDLQTLDYENWYQGLLAGVAAHHAGMIPLFKEVVEELFAAGLIKVVYATETLALGINMPARSVVLEKLTKWNGSSHQDLTPGEYTQLTGRAGRRGIDVEGHAIVVEHPGLDVYALAGLASRRTYPLRSSFNPSYNMTVNLTATVGVDRAREVLQMSFAQFQADRSVVGQARRVQELDQALTGFHKAAFCEQGDFMAYAKLREELNRAEKAADRQRSKVRREQVAQIFDRLRVGDVIQVSGGRHSGWHVVVDPDSKRFPPKPITVTDKAKSVRLNGAEVHGGIALVGTLRVPKGFTAKQITARKHMASQLTELKRNHVPQRHLENAAVPDFSALKAQLRNHPCHQCPDREAHARWAERYFQALREKDRLVGEITRSTGSIAGVFDRRLTALRTLNYLDENNELTSAGQTLRRLYVENDIVMAECLRHGVWDDLNPAGLAAAVAALLYQARLDERGESVRIPGGTKGAIYRALRQTQHHWSEINALHQKTGLPELNQLQWALVGPVYRWAQGRSLAVAIGDLELAPGDMVRWCKQVIDALEHIATANPESGIGQKARHAVGLMRRGVVAY